MCSALKPNTRYVYRRHMHSSLLLQNMVLKTRRVSKNQHTETPATTPYIATNDGEEVHRTPINAYALRLLFRCVPVLCVPRRSTLPIEPQRRVRHRTVGMVQLALPGLHAPRGHRHGPPDRTGFRKSQPKSENMAKILRWGLPRRGEDAQGRRVWNSGGRPGAGGRPATRLVQPGRPSRRGYPCRC